MKRIITTQIRLIIGTMAMWILGSLIFGTNLVSYGVTSCIRMCFYLEGALLVVTLIGWPLVALNILGDLIEWLQITNERYKIFTKINDISDFTDEEFGLLSEDEETDVESEDIEAEQFLLEIEEAIRKKLPVEANNEESRVEYRRTLDEVDKRNLDALWLAADSIETSRLIINGRCKWKLEKSDSKINGKDIIPVLESETVGE